MSLVNGHGESRVTGFGSMRQLLGIDLNVLRPRRVEKDEYQRVAGLRHCIAALAFVRTVVTSSGMALNASATLAFGVATLGRDIAI